MDLKYNYVAQNKYVRIDIAPNFSIEHSTPLFFHNEWDIKVKIQNRSDSFITIVEMIWRTVDSYGKPTQEKQNFLDKKKQILLPEEVYSYKKKSSLSSTTGLVHGFIKLKIQNETKETTLKLPTTLLDSPFNKKTYH